MALSRFPDAAAITGRIPRDRDRFADFLRLAAISLVIVGHWGIAVIALDDGGLVAGQLLAIAPATQLLTWVFQVMPVFFFVGGYVNAGSWERAAAMGEGWSVWVRRRAQRLLTPLVPLLALWLLAAVILDALAFPARITAQATEAALLPAWFIVVYLLVVALVPVTLTLHRRAGAWPVIGALALTVVIQRLHHAGTPAVGFANYLLVWGAIHQLGYFWHDRRIPRRPRVLLATSAIAAGATLAVIGLTGHPLSMVAVWGAERHNTDPPTIVLATFAVALLSLIMAVREPVRAWLERPRVYAPVVVGGSVVLTLFVWHMTAMIIAVGVSRLLGWLPRSMTIDVTWWAWRPAWLALCALALTVLVLLFHRFEQVPAQAGHHVATRHHAPLRTAVGVVATTAGLAVILTGGAYDPARLIGIPIAAVVVLSVGVVLLGVVPRFDLPVRGRS